MKLVKHKTFRKVMRCEGCGLLFADSFTYFCHIHDCTAYNSLYTDSFARPSDMLTA